MSRTGHGEVETATRVIGLGLAPVQAGLFSASLDLTMLATAGKAADFGYMFGPSPDQRPSAAERLPEGPATISDLIRLGEAMGAGERAEPDPAKDRAAPGDGTIPAGYTYFGQFVDHDITATGGVPDITTGRFDPLESIAQVSNGRTAHLELDSVYGRPGSLDNQVPRPDEAKMVLGKVSVVGGAGAGTPPFAFVEGKQLLNDLPRKPRSPDSRIDREALIGDARNDENLIIAQMHVAFLKAHNTLADELQSFEAARKALTLIYQSVIVDDYLPLICDGATLDRILTEGPRFFDPAGPAFMPLEFAAAAYRFGHSMVRTAYDFNRNFPSTESTFMFTFTALSGNIAPAGVPVDAAGNPIGSPEALGSDTFPHNWIIDWLHFLPLDPAKPPQRARPIDPLLTPLLAQLRNSFGNPMQNPAGTTLNIAPHLAKRNLLRGYLMSLPTGEALAARIGAGPIEINAETTSLPEEALKPFAGRTPPWLYILAEARANGGKLGVVGTTIVAETLVGLIKRSTPSIFDSDGRRISEERHRLADIIALADRQDAVT